MRVGEHRAREGRAAGRECSALTVAAHIQLSRAILGGGERLPHEVALQELVTVCLL